jgi:hypothetical protein
MENNNNIMEVEDLAKIDFFIRTSNIKNPILEVDSLILGDGNTTSLSKFKDAAYKLNEIENIKFSNNEKQTWQNLFNKQVKFSVARAKELRNKTS